MDLKREVERLQRLLGEMEKRSVRIFPFGEVGQLKKPQSTAGHGIRRGRWVIISPVPKISVVLPVHNEAPNLPELSERLRRVLDDLVSGDWEVIMVDDGSTDGSWEIMKSLREGDRRFKLIRLSRNFGQYPALAAGLDATSGDCVLFMDSDLQEPPEEIPKFYAEFMKGYDMVYGIRKRRQDSLARRFYTWVFWVLMRSAMGIKMPPYQSLMRLASRRAASAMKGLVDTSRFFAGAFAWVGFRETRVEITYMPRKAGKSSYNLVSMARVILNAVLSYSHLPLRVASIMGILFIVPAVGLAIYYIIARLSYIDVPGFTTIVILILFIGGLQMLLLGIIGEYIARIFADLKARPPYIVEEAQVGED